MQDVFKQGQKPQTNPPYFRAVWVYFARVGDLIKIGATCNPTLRHKQLHRPEFLFGFYAPGPDSGYDIEAAFHRHFKGKLRRGRDYFELTEEDLQAARTLPIVCGIGEPPIVRDPSCECHSRLGESFNWVNLPKRPAVIGRVRPKATKDTESSTNTHDSRICSDRMQVGAGGVDRFVRDNLNPVTAPLSAQSPDSARK